MNLAKTHGLRILREWEIEKEKDIEKINSGNLPLESKMNHIKDIISEHMKDRMEMECTLIRNDILDNPDAIRAEMQISQDQIGTSPEFLKEILRQHVFECSALLSRLT